MDREAVARRHTFRTAYLFSGVPGVRVDFDALGEPELLMRSGTGACRPMVYLDRMPLGSSELELFTWPDKLQGVEVYRDAAFTPAEFNRGGGCGSIVLWTRPPEPKPRRAGRATR
jgi:hypothetical protein